ncbi:MAG: glycine cleavage system protein H [Candidatus Aminicenantes bacterium]|nr:glycine cleavage system protein H [Candidatus Aminicenantes bacterium]
MNNSKTSQGLRIIPTGERKCIWMETGVVSFKLCTNQFQCTSCSFDLAMSNQAQKSKEAVLENRPGAAEKKQIVEWMEKFRELPADQRKCRYMMSGDVPYKICPNSFRCGECSYDQMMQDRMQPVYVPALDQVAGFFMSEEYYYFRNHTWLHLQRNGKYRVGIDDFARRIIGKTKGIKLPPVGRNLDLEQYAWTVNHEYGDLEFIAPAAGVVDSVNRDVVEDAGKVTEEPYKDGWLMTIEPKNITKSNKNFLKGAEARAWMLDESNLLSKTISDKAGVTMHDGAEMVKDLSAHIDKEKWQEIVKNHLHVK